MDLFFPRRCALCGREGTFLCTPCAADLPRLHDPLCPRCGLPLSQGGGARSRGVPLGLRSAGGSTGVHPLGGPPVPCGACAEWPSGLDGLRSLWAMEGPARQLVHRLKYGGLRALGDVLGHELADLLREWAPPVEAVVPVPLHPRRLRERGFDQAELLARSLAREAGLPSLPLLVRRRATASQARTADREERRRNVAGAFDCPDPAPAAGRRLLLVDDVATTGETLLDAARALRSAGAASVWAITLAREV